MAIPEQELKFFSFGGGMNTELGLVNTDAKSAKNLENIELQEDGSAKRRSGLAFFRDAANPSTVTTTSETLNITSQRSSTGWVYPAPSMYFWRTYNGDNIIDLLLVGNVSKETGIPTLQMKKIAGLSDLETWRTDQGTELVNAGATGIAGTLTANYPWRFADGGDFVFALNSQVKEPIAIIGPNQTTTLPFNVKTRGPNSTTVDSVVSQGSGGYKCIKSHTSVEADNKPASGTNWRDYWVKTGPKASEPAWANSTSYDSSIDDLHVTYTDSSMLTHVAFTGQRAWYTGVTKSPSTIFVSQPFVMRRVNANKIRVFGYCFSINDPLSATDSSASAADGGTVDIREAGIIKSIVPFREGLIAFATNGVWAIPNAGNFDATSFDVLKVSDIPITGADAFAVTDFGVVYFGLNSVQMITITENGDLISKEISQPIKTFYNSVSEYSKDTSFAVYNRLEQRVYWFTTFTEPLFPSTEGTYRNANYNKLPIACQDILILDFKSQGWYKYTIRKDKEISSSEFMIAHAITFIGDFGETPTVISLSGNSVKAGVGGVDDVLASSFDGTNIQEFLITLVTKKDTIAAGADKFEYGFAHFKGDVVQDFDNLLPADAAFKHTFDSEILSHPYNFEDIGHAKQAPYVHTIFKRVETGILDSNGNDLTPGGCLLQFRWNWSTGDKAGPQFGTAFQAYRPFRRSIDPGDGTLPDLESVLNRHKIRGRGKALQLRFTNDGTKRFHLLGYQLEVEATKKV
jgi:hypothetical protein